MKKNARDTAVRALLRQQSAGSYSNLLIDSVCAQDKLDPRDAKFARALFYGTLERRLTLDHLLRQHSARPLEKLSPAVREILRAGAYQLLYMDVDDYAAVSESVEQAKRLQCGRASGFVNGVLRSLLRDNKRIPPVEGSRAAQLEVEYACPAWLVEIWLAHYGEQACLRMLEQSLGKPPLYLRANTIRISAQVLAQQLQAQGAVCRLLEPEGCIELISQPVATEQLNGFTQGLFHVQDRASQLCAAAVDAQPGMRVLDTCAAPGGKSFTVAQRMQGSGELIARDLHEKRARLVQEGARRLGLSNLHASAGDASVYAPELGRFDRVLCDVPCSGFGVIRRRPEIKYKTPESIRNLPQVQYKILQTSSQYLKEGGRLIYSTCTLLPQENEQVVMRFLAQAKGFQLISQHSYTGEDSDGFFVAVLQRE